VSDPSAHKLPPLPENETLRLHQANERTLLAWIRTAIAMIGFGFVVARFGIFLREISEVQHRSQQNHNGSPFSLWLGVALAVLGAATVIAGLIRFRRIGHAIERHEVGAPGGVLLYMVGALIAALGIAVAGVLVGS
jgi:putative membrane protein